MEIDFEESRLFLLSRFYQKHTADKWVSRTASQAEGQVTQQPAGGCQRDHFHQGQKRRLLQLLHEEEECSHTSQAQQFLPGDGESAPQEIRANG